MAEGNVLMPDAFNERFTLYLNTEGNPVERTLREMTGGEVLLAHEWIVDEADRCRREAEAFKDFETLDAEVKSGRITGHEARTLLRASNRGEKTCRRRIG